MGWLQDSINLLKGAVGDLYPDQVPSQPSFPEVSPQGPQETVITIRKSSMGNKPQNPEPLGKITSYNWKGDPYTDTNSRNMVGSFGKLSNEGMAVSPDIEKQFREAGIKPKDKVNIVLADGTELQRVWDDRTMQDKQAIRKYGEPLRGRFDLNFPQGNKPHEKDGLAVVGFKKVGEGS